jgi:hypothetical protein
MRLLQLFTAAPSFEFARPAKAHLPVIVGPWANGELQFRAIECHFLRRLEFEYQAKHHRGSRIALYGAAKKGSSQLKKQLETVLSAMNVLALEAPADARYGELILARGRHARRTDTIAASSLLRLAAMQGIEPIFRVRPAWRPRVASNQLRRSSATSSRAFLLLEPSLRIPREFGCQGITIVPPPPVRRNATVW